MINYDINKNMLLKKAALLSQLILTSELLWKNY